MKLKYFAVILFVFVFFVACDTTGSKQDSSLNLSPYLKELFKQTKQYPDSVNLRINLINALDSSGLHKEALQQMDLLIAKDSLNFAFWNAKGHLQENAKDTAGAIVSYKRAFRVYPSPDAMLTLANLFAETKNDTALVLCKEVNGLSADKKYEADCRFIEGVYYARKGNIQQALTSFDACINARYTYVVAYLEKGFIYYDKNQYAEALKIFQLAASVSNAYADAYYWQAKCFEAMNNRTEALTNYNKALALDKNLTEAAAAVKRLQ
jgi:tetratricopeptide (TPR) repeat protein